MNGPSGVGNNENGLEKLLETALCECQFHRGFRTGRKQPYFLISYFGPEIGNWQRGGLAELLPIATLVVRIHAFLSEFLRFRNLRSCHHFFHFCPVIRAQLITIRTSDVEPHMSKRAILQNAVTVCVHRTQAELTIRISLLSRLAIPPNRFLIVLSNALSEVVHRTQHVLRPNIPLSSSLNAMSECWRK